MKYFILSILASLLISNSTIAQNSGAIDYTQTIYIHKNLKGKQLAMKALLPETLETELRLSFDGSQGRLKKVESKKKKGAVQMSMSGASVNSFIDFNNKKINSYHKLMGNDYYLEEDFVDQKALKMTSETKNILGYICTKAIMESDKDDMTLWIAKKLKVNASPMLPIVCSHGAILEIESEKIGFKATKVTLEKPSKEDLSPIAGAKKITKEQLQDLQEEQLEEMGGNAKTIGL